MHKPALVAAAAFIVAFGVHAQQQMPTDVQLRAAYCIVVTQKRIEHLQKLPASSDAKVQQLMNRDIDGAKNRLNRLQTQLQALDSPLIAEAKKRAETDFPSYSPRTRKLAPKCTAECRVSTSQGEAQFDALRCFDSCMVRDELIARVSSCYHQLDWLP